MEVGRRRRGRRKGNLLVGPAVELGVGPDGLDLSATGGGEVL